MNATMCTSIKKTRFVLLAHNLYTVHMGWHESNTTLVYTTLT